MTFLAPPELQTTLIHYLRPLLQVPIYAEDAPRNNNTPHVRVATTFGQEINVAQRDETVLVECWHTNPANSAALARSTWARLRDAKGKQIGGVMFYRVTLGTPVPLYGLTTTLSRYQFTAAILTRLVPVA